ncbi:hypothetical protein BGZ61DRAFT_535690 [Ilyonectria robusta]|uniref:uncharacterized protein n=1 Tax=Ilyonectria robusta TaxID=1079257 RepID=UPI001E8E260C|nr:uncharacterized protein BGZ61DRAFT_535690 [Ilyonectria robusta]KAH8679282.1 hypothetical protein BGZ61DRAFT_535690 [Ilyonectria robusta]
MTHLKAAELEQLTDQNILRQSLAVGSVVLTASSFARRRAHRAAFRPEFEEEMRQIGEGLQGAIFEQFGLSVALKKEAPGNESGASNLQHEYKIHVNVHRAFNQYDGQIGSHISVPCPFSIILTVQDQFWKDYLQRFPTTYRLRTNVVEMERILPLPKVIRKSLIRQFYPRPDGQDSIDPAVLDEILSDPANKDCLARPYLGQSEGQYNGATFSLRNFPLYLKDMEKLGLGVKDMARCMGKAYAIMHWGAGADSDDAEFVLGSSVISDSESSDIQHRETGLYLLDFGQCVSVDLAQPRHVVYQAFKGAMVTGDNQKFIPHYSRTPELFREFRQGYMESGQIILKDKGMDHQFDMKDFMDEYEEYAEDFLY